MYNLPELLDIATKTVKETTLDIDQAVLLWTKSFEANNDDLRDYSSEHINTLMSEVDEFHTKISHLDKDLLVSLFQDISQVKSNKRRKLT